MANEPLPEVFLDILVQYLQFRRGETVIVAREWRGSFLLGGELYDRSSDARGGVSASFLLNMFANSEWYSSGTRLRSGSTSLIVLADNSEIETWKTWTSRRFSSILNATALIIDTAGAGRELEIGVDLESGVLLGQQYPIYGISFVPCGE